MTNSRRPGRPRKGDEVTFPQDEVDSLLVHGEVIEGRQQYPSFRDLGKRYNVSHSVVADFARTHDCLERRRRAQQKVQALTDQAMVEQVATAKIISAQDRMQMLSDFASAVWQRVKEGRARTDSFADACQAIKLMMLIEAEEAARAEGVGAGSLLKLQERYQVFLESTTNIPFELTGLVAGQDSAIEAGSIPIAQQSQNYEKQPC